MRVVRIGRASWCLEKLKKSKRTKRTTHMPWGSDYFWSRRATTVVIAEGAQMVGDVVAEELTINGRVKGTINANRVKLRGSGVVDGDILHRTLSIEENAQFEGRSRRRENARSIQLLLFKRITLNPRPRRSKATVRAAVIDRRTKTPAQMSAFPSGWTAGDRKSSTCGQGCGKLLAQDKNWRGVQTISTPRRRTRSL